MKTFKKRHDYLPTEDRIRRLILRESSPNKLRMYDRWLRSALATLPMSIRVTTLAHTNPTKRQEIRYFPDLRSFIMYEQPTRSLPVGKFLDLFRGMIPQEQLDEINQSLTDFRVVISKDRTVWLDVYKDENIHSCMSPTGEIARNRPLPACYAHPENKLAIAALYPPGSSQVIARTIVNTDEKWYVRLFGDPLLVEKLNAQGYSRLNCRPKAFKMYGYVDVDPGDEFDIRDVKLPYFDIYGHDGGRLPRRILPETYDAETGFVEVIINEGVSGNEERNS